ncbi:sporulation integral membrane protein YlbJ [Sulfoacidibacillus thermotolerans]|uniref:sporulation integral membrane protein YlbJ n=1 Tax=Sulfoacidibacillus thermotolerans TaxID=1765684 RepID=UPI001FE31B4E|nr:sporulation integral membrane protein YlbJ [Sulfoacidibacillus thermotolerans]
MQRRRKQIGTMLLATVVVLFTASLVVYPEQGFETGIEGLKVFWDVVFPSLLPFFILSDLLLGLGVVNALGVFLEPLMRPVFNVPGVGAFALSMGLAAGYPMDAVIAAKFRRTGACTRVEGERLLAFTNTADPLFMFGAVAVGMFKSPALGGLLALAHYLSALLVGLTFKFYGRKEERYQSPHVDSKPKERVAMWKRAYQEMMRARAADNRPFGKLLGDAVTDSVRTLLMIGGFIIFFAVLLRVMTQIGVVGLLALPLAALFQVIHLNPSLITPLIKGLFEIDIGSAATATASATLVERLSVASAIIAWSGLAVHAQVASVLTDTDIRFRPYVIARIYQAFIAAVLTVVFYKMGIGTRIAMVPHAVAAMAPMTGGLMSWANSLTEITTWVALLAIASAVSLSIHFVKRFKIAFFYSKGA